MSNVQNIPLIEREKIESKTYKMVFTTGLIIILILMMLHYTKGSNNYLYSTPPVINVTKKSAAKQNKPIMGSVVRLINTSKNIPINKISIINNDRKITNISSDKAVTKQHCKGGMIMTFKIKKPTNIHQIVIDTDMLQQDSINIVDTQVEIVNKGKVLWVNDNKLSYKRYNYIYFDDVKEYTPTKLDVFYKPNMTDYEQEVLLTQKLMINTWD